MCADEKQEQEQNLPEIHIQFNSEESIYFRYQIKNANPNHLILVGARLLEIGKMGLQDEQRAKQMAALKQQADLAKVAQMVRGKPS